jgi:hypothetical protein
LQRQTRKLRQRLETIHPTGRLQVLRVAS